MGAVPVEVAHVANRDPGDEPGGAERPAQPVRADRVRDPGVPGEAGQGAGRAGTSMHRPVRVRRIGPVARPSTASRTARTTGIGSGGSASRA